VALVWVLLAILVLGGVAVVAAGRGQGLTAPEPDRPTLALPPDRPLTRYDVDRVRFSVGLRGYRMDEVDDVLDRLAMDLENRDARISVLEQEVAAKWVAGTSGPEPVEAAAAHAEPADAVPDVGAPAEEAAEAEDGESAEAEDGEAAEEEHADDEAPEGDADDADAAAEDDGDVLVERTLIVPFQQTDSRLAPPRAEDDEQPGPGA
jgi:DivIVA domain-containing protein